MSGERVLLFDLDARHCEAARHCLAEAGMHVQVARDSSDVEREIAAAPPDLLLIDWDLPGHAGLELLQSVSESRVRLGIRVLITSALASESDIVTGLEFGADDYLTKPCSLRELVARVNALLRGRRHADGEERLEVGELTLDLADRRAYVGEQVIALHGAQLRLLAHFMVYRDHALSRAQLLNPVWGQSSGIDERTVDVNVRRLRQVLGGVGLSHYVQTVRGVGYRLSARS